MLIRQLNQCKLIMRYEIVGSFFLWNFLVFWTSSVRRNMLGYAITTSLCSTATTMGDIFIHIQIDISEMKVDFILSNL